MYFAPPNLKTWLRGGPFFTFRLPGGAFRPSASRQLRHWLWYIVFAYSKLFVLYCNKIRHDGVA